MPDPTTTPTSPVATALAKEIAVATGIVATAAQFAEVAAPLIAKRMAGLVEAARHLNHSEACAVYSDKVLFGESPPICDCGFDVFERELAPWLPTGDLR